MYACSNHCTPPHPSPPHCGQVPTRTTHRINLLTATVQNEIISNNYENALYMFYRGIWWSSKLPRYKFKEVNKRFWVLMILLGLYRDIWWSSYRGIKLKEVNKHDKWFWVLMILLGLYRGIWWSNYRGMNLKEVNKWFWVLMILLGLYRGMQVWKRRINDSEWWYCYGPSWNSNYRLVYAHLNKGDYLAPTAQFRNDT